MLLLGLVVACVVVLRTHELPKDDGVESSRAPRKDVRPGAGRAVTTHLVPLFNRDDLIGWSKLVPDDRKWELLGGILEGRGGGFGKPAILVTERANFANFRLIVRYRCQKEGGGNIEIRRSPAGENQSGYLIRHGAWPTSVRTDIPIGSIDKRLSDDPWYGAGWENQAEAVPAPLNVWNTLEIKADWNRITASVNEKKVAEYTDASGWYSSGAIALNV
jgi:hypothetical protein